MTVSRPGMLKPGDEVRLGNGSHTVIAVAAAAVRLADVTGTESVVPLAQLLADPAFELITARRPARLAPEGLLSQLPAAVAGQARWWEQHILEVVTGLRPESGPGAVPRPEYDPATRSMRQREIAKVAELSAAGHQTGLSTFQRLRREYETEGVWGLVDQRSARPAAPGGRVDPRVVDAVRQAVSEETGKSTGTRGRLRRRVEQILAETHGLDACGHAGQDDVLPAGGAGLARQAHVRVCADPPVAGPAPAARSGRSARPARVSGCRLTPRRWMCGWCSITACWTGPS